MKRVLPLLFVGILAASCRKPAAPEAAATPDTAAPTSAAASSAASPEGSAPAIKPVPTEIPAVIATVNGEKIERWELEDAVRQVEAGHGGAPVPPEQRDEIFRGLVDQLIAYHLVAQEAHARKLDPSDADIAARMTEARSGYPTEEAFQKALAGVGLTLEQLQRQTRLRLAIAKVVETDVNTKIIIVDSDIEAFYKQNNEGFKQGETVHASHILIGAPQGADAAQKQQARAKAEDLLKRLRGGADFGGLARQQSQDPGSAPAGGDLGFLPKGQLDPAFETAMFALKPGTLSGVVETPFGYHIIKVHERRPPRTQPLEEVKGQIKDFLSGQQRNNMLNAIVEQAKAKGKIDILM